MGYMLCVCLATVLLLKLSQGAAKVSETVCTKDTSGQCTGINNAECDNAVSNAKCKCSDGYKEDSSDGSTCVKILDSACTTSNGNTVCTVANSECKSTLCKCSAGYTESSAVCKKVLDSACTTSNGNTVCTVANSECKSSLCKCSAGYTESNAVCKKVLDSACTTSNGNTVCTVANSECKSSLCKCSEGYTESSAVCKKVLDSACTTSNGNTVCTVANSECKSSLCKCSAGYTESNAVCKKEDGQACANNEECSSNKCEDSGGKKTCKFGYSQYKDNPNQSNNLFLYQNIAHCGLKTKPFNMIATDRGAEGNSAKTVVLAAGMIFLSLLVTVLQRLV